MPVCGAAVVRAASKEGRKEAVVGQGREAAAATEATGACCTTQRKLGKTAIDDAPAAHRGSKAHRGREVVKQPNWLPLQSTSLGVK